MSIQSSHRVKLGPLVRIRAILGAMDEAALPWWVFFMYVILVVTCPVWGLVLVLVLAPAAGGAGVFVALAVFLIVLRSPYDYFLHVREAAHINLAIRRQVLAEELERRGAISEAVLVEQGQLELVETGQMTEVALPLGGSKHSCTRQEGV